MSDGSGRSYAKAVLAPQIVVITLPTAIDASNNGLVQTALTSALATRPAVLIADGTETAFCDSSGMAALIRARRRAVVAGAELRLVMTGSSVRRLLRLTGADQVLPVYPSLADARADGSHQTPLPSAAAPEQGRPPLLSAAAPEQSRPRRPAPPAPA